MRRALVAACLLLASCSNIEKATPRPTTANSTVVSNPNDVDPIMRGTVASEAVLIGFEDVIVRGYGLVVGLSGTGSRAMPAEVRALLLQEIARRDVADTTTGMGISPERLLDSDDIAAVVIEGVIPAGATGNSKFDVRVYAVPGSGTTSLEGGRLWTADLRPGPLVAGSKQSSSLADARGPIVINPFVTPGNVKRDNIDRLSGRILNGGKVVKDMPLKLRLATPSHTRAATLANAINSRFPREIGQRYDTAHGKNGDSIDITVPPTYQERTSEFAQLVRHTTLDVQNSEATASAVRRSLLAMPGAASAASWRWQAIGKKSLPMLQDLYTYPEDQPRMAALEAGSRLDDPLCVNPMLEMAKNGETSIRLAAIRLMGKMGPNPAIDIGLRPLLDDSDLDIRLTTYEALRRRNDPLIRKLRVNDKFDLDLVPSNKPLVYASQTGAPRLAVFGEELSLKSPMAASIWNGRLIVKWEPEDSKALVFYRAPNASRAKVEQVNPSVAEFIAYLARKPDPSGLTSGLDLRYGETLSVLHELSRTGDLNADFRAEQDRILAEILRKEKDEKVEERPEFPPDAKSAAAQKPLVPGRENSGDATGAGLEGKPKAADTVPR